MSLIDTFKETVLQGKLLGKEEALQLFSLPCDALCQAADEIRRHFCGNAFDLCTIVNGKCGKCSEDCKYCAQSAHYPVPLNEYPLLGTAELLKQAEYNAQRGVLRYSIVTSGRALSDGEIDQVCESLRVIRRSVPIRLCVSFGLLTEAQFRRLKEAGADRVHCNLETSRRYFPQVCTTHTYDEKLQTIRAAQNAGLAVCSGGIMGLGESLEDRVEMALTLREIGIQSVPVNFLNPIPGTPYQHNPPLSEEEKKQVIAVYRFLLPHAVVRLAGGRGLMPDQGAGCFASGANAAISGDMLTTTGITIERDKALTERLGYEIRL